MNKIVLSLMLCFGLTGLAKADIFVFHNELLNIRIDTNKSCGEKVKAMLEAAPKDLEWVSASVVYRGVEFEACAAPATAPDGTPSALIIDEEGDGGYVPLVKFVNESKNI